MAEIKFTGLREFGDTVIGILESYIQQEPKQVRSAFGSKKPGKEIEEQLNRTDDSTRNNVQGDD